MTNDEDTISKAEHDFKDDMDPQQIPSSSRIKLMRCLALLLVVLVYLFAGALVFRALERPSAIKAAQDFDAALELLTSENDCVDESDVDELMDIVTRAIGEGGYDGSIPYAAQLSKGIRNNTLLSKMWSITNTFLFSTTVVTTIGYGYTAPHTGMGEIVCMIYSFLGIVLAGSIILTVGKIFHGLGQCKLTKCTKKTKFCKVGRPQLWSKAAVLINTLLVFVLLLIPLSLLYSSTQHWTFLESFYFSVIAMTTIGFGDKKTAYPDIPLWQELTLKSVYFAYFFVCLGVMSTMFEKISRAQQRAASAMSSRLYRKPDTEVELAVTPQVELAVPLKDPSNVSDRQ